MLLHQIQIQKNFIQSWQEGGGDDDDDEGPRKGRMLVFTVLPTVVQTKRIFWITDVSEVSEVFS